MRAAIALGALILVTASAYGKTACLRMNDMWSWSPVDNTTITVETRRHEKFKVSIRGACPAIMQNKLRLELRSRSNSDLACLTNQDDVIIYGDTGPQRCMITSIAPIVPARPAQ